MYVPTSKKYDATIQKINKNGVVYVPVKQIIWITENL
jgi:hypothetical protein